MGHPRGERRGQQRATPRPRAPASARRGGGRASVLGTDACETQLARASSAACPPQRPTRLGAQRLPGARSAPASGVNGGNANVSRRPRAEATTAPGKTGRARIIPVQRGRERAPCQPEKVPVAPRSEGPCDPGLSRVCTEAWQAKVTEGTGDERFPPQGTA